MHAYLPTRRDFLASSAIASAVFASPWSVRADTPAGDRPRRFHACIASKVIAAEPSLLRLVRDAGVTDLWQAAYFYGHWYETPEALARARKVVEDAGLRWHLINVPLGHPGDSLGDPAGETPLSPPGRWRMAERPDGSRYSGTSLHAPATEENVEALRQLAALQPDTVFLDDDFRLATGPGVIGGCYCAEHRARFLQLHGYAEGRWEELLEEVRTRRLTPLLRAWVDFTCDELTASFRAQQAAIPGAALGNMIMYLGAEKAGIRLPDYAATPFRVGELMFDDNSFGTVKGKTDELFSVLFHRRFAQPQLAYSETTAYPHDKLSAPNMAAKLVISTIADVRHTMFMSGLSPIPAAHWDTLAPAMREQARLHERLIGHRLAGPLKHYWGEAARYAGDDRPYSLFLALGIPFEVADTPPAEGMTFLCDQDAQHLPAATLGTCTGVCRPGVPGAPAHLRQMDESLDALWALKRELTQGAPDFPYIMEESPAVCAWYPSAHGALVWNLQTETTRLTLRHAAQDIPLTLPALAATFVPL
jgi:hypothetical protein